MNAQATRSLQRLRAFDPLAAGASTALRYVLLDAFSDTALAGNQLAVFPDAAGLEPERMQLLARELKLPESVFVLEPERVGDARVRIFTPSTELPFAGHPVLGSAVLLSIASGQEQVALETGAGVIEVRVRRDAPLRGEGWMRQPLPRWQEFGRAPQLLAALGLERSGLPVELYDNGPRHVYAEHESPQALAALSPDPRALRALGELTISCFARAGESWKTRVFCPALGVEEDGATGSAAGPLAVHLARHGRISYGEQIEIRQGEEIGRPSLLYARVRAEGERLEAVEVGGSAVIVAAGAFAL